MGFFVCLLFGWLVSWFCFVFVSLNLNIEMGLLCQCVILCGSSLEQQIPLPTVPRFLLTK